MSNKIVFGEVESPPVLVELLLEMIPQKIYQNPSLKWCDAGAGSGNISKALVNKLKNNLLHETPETHIYENMCTLIEINLQHIPTLQSISKNVIHDDYLNYADTMFDVIVGNPPFTCNGEKKVPSKMEMCKKDDGITIWTEFIKHSLALLKPDGYLCFIVPSLWLRPDKRQIYQLLNGYHIHKIRSFSDLESNKLFEYNCQTPTTMFLLQKKSSPEYVFIYDNIHESYVEYPLYNLDKYVSYPTFGAKCLRHLLSVVSKYGHIKASKSSMPSIHNTFKDVEDSTHTYVNINTCVLENRKPTLVTKYSSLPCAYYEEGTPKLVLAHGRCGFPFLDSTGKFGISNRDKYIVNTYNLNTLKKFHRLFSTRFALFVFDCVKYRMKFIEKEAFEYFPDISNEFEDCSDITDEALFDLFNISQQDRTYILKNYEKYEYRRVN